MHVMMPPPMPQSSSMTNQTLTLGGMIDSHQTFALGGGNQHQMGPNNLGTRSFQSLESSSLASKENVIDYQLLTS
jgi:hypothetical protein